MEGRQVVTFHNQRDFIFVRHHRYVYRKEDKVPANSAVLAAKRQKKKEGKDSTVQLPTTTETTRARLQELGPRFTLKLKWLQEGTFNTEFGEYEWVHKRKQMEQKSRRKFFL